MSSISIPIAERSRKYGYIYWTSDLDVPVKNFLGDVSAVKLYFEGADHGKKKVDWQYRRISVGPRWTRKIPQGLSKFVLTWKDNRVLSVICR
jgi:hypothetical protein